MYDTDSLGSLDDSRHARRVMMAGSVGTFIEYYDLGVYGLLATTLAPVFFPSNDKIASLLSTFAVFALAFVARPIGGLFFGHFGDRIGRRTTLVVALTMMAVGTTGIGILPAYSSVGVLAPTLLVVLRILQGFSTGGEFSGATSLMFEYAPKNRRGLYVSPIEAASVISFIVALLIILPLSALMPTGSFASWGWRIPFLLAAPFGLIGLYLRARIEESPAFKELRQRNEVRPAPLREAIKTQHRTIGVFLACAAVNAIAFYILSSYMATYLTVNLGYSKTSAYIANGVGLVALCVAGPFVAHLSDRVGRRPVMLVSLAVFAIAAVPSFMMLTAGGGLGIIGMIVFAVSFAGVAFMNPILAAELFPARVRYSSNGLGYNIGYAVFGGTAPYISTVLIAQSRSSLAPGFYAMAVAIGAFVVVWAGLRETYRIDSVSGPNADGEADLAPHLEG